MGKRYYCVLLLVLLLSTSMYVVAQTVRDYAITESGYEFTEIDGQSIALITVVIENIGGDATNESTAVIYHVVGSNRENLAETIIDPLDAGEGTVLQIPINVRRFPPSTQQTFEVVVAVDNFERENSIIAQNNVDTIVIDIPARVSTSFTYFERTSDGIILLGQAYSLTEVALAALGAVGILMLFWLFTVIVRIIFVQPPRFGQWQPPYGLMPMYDQNSIEGRRWAWQQHAQNGLLLAPPTDGNIHPIKLLTDASGQNLTNWKVTAMRLSQYDTYGRIARTQALASTKIIRKLNNMLKKRSSMTEEKIQKVLRPIAWGLVKQFNKNLSKKNAFLPIALDMRLEGNHGEVRIFFELYQFQQQAWYRIDQWEPMMQIVSRTLQENYTFTIHGKEQQENMRSFRERLRDDIIWLFLESIRIEQPIPQEISDQPVAREQYNIPDTLSGMTPMPSEPLPISPQGDA